ncbi:hypothetical protein SLE2022_126000 [Rubroshorea leprosula]
MPATHFVVEITIKVQITNSITPQSGEQKPRQEWESQLITVPITSAPQSGEQKPESQFLTVLITTFGEIRLMVVRWSTADGSGPLEYCKGRFRNV